MSDRNIASESDVANTSCWLLYVCSGSHLSPTPRCLWNNLQVYESGARAVMHALKILLAIVKATWLPPRLLLPDRCILLFMNGLRLDYYSCLFLVESGNINKRETTSKLTQTNSHDRLVLQHSGLSSSNQPPGSSRVVRQRPHFVNNLDSLETFRPFLVSFWKLKDVGWSLVVQIGLNSETYLDVKDF